MSIIDKLGITEGPWETEHRKTGDYDPDGQEYYGTQVFTKEIVIADIGWCGEKTSNGWKSLRDNNAKLIAAAPEMLEALIKSALIDEKAGYTMLANEAITIIQKATGKTWAEIKELL